VALDREIGLGVFVAEAIRRSRTNPVKLPYGGSSCVHRRVLISRESAQADSRPQAMRREFIRPLTPTKPGGSACFAVRFAYRLSSLEVGHGQ
jgi:hypothetical protein